MSRTLFVTLALFVAFAACADDAVPTGTQGSGNSGAGASGTGTGMTDRIETILALTGDIGAGEAAFPGTCGQGANPCHEPDGTSGGGVADDLTVITASLSDEEIVGVVLNGKGNMPNQAGLPNQEIADLLAYMRDAWD